MGIRPAFSAAIELMTRLIHERQPERHAILRASDFRDVTLAGDVFDQVDMAGFDGDLFASCDFDLSAAGKRDHVLAAWSGVPIGY